MQVLFMFPFSLDQTYRLDIKVDGEAVGLEIVDTANQVRHHVHMSINTLLELESVTQQIACLLYVTNSVYMWLP